MTQKLIFLDIDGTLVAAGTNVPPPSAVEAIRGARKKGHKVFLCTGRNYGMLSPLLPYGFDGFIGSAGGYIEYGGEVIYDCPMTEAQRVRVMDVFQRSGVFRTVECKRRAYTDEGFKAFLGKTAGTGGSELARWREQLEHRLGIRPMQEYQGEPVYKIVFMSPDRERLEAPRAALEGEFAFCMEDGARNGLINGELINRKFNKGLAVRRLCAYLGLPLEDTVAFGDSMNDLEMLETAGLGICMGNGVPALRKFAREICPPVNEDGLYRAFEAHGFL